MPIFNSEMIIFILKLYILAKNAYFEFWNCYFHLKNDQFWPKMAILRFNIVIFIPKMINFSQKCLFQQFLWFPAQLMSTPLKSDDLSS